MNKEINTIVKMIKQINKQLEQYNKRLNTVMKQTNYPTGITYDQLSKNIAEISRKEYYEEIKIERIE